MFLALLYSLIIHQTVTFANPYHKYPYAFLLDIGNEELQAYSKQFRVSVPGGSLALRYPAIAEGDTIAHVRVTGIDFDNDLKANIVDGGPGYKYVVIVFMGSPGKAYDAVITVATLDDEEVPGDAEHAGTNEVKSYKVTESDEDSNDGAETDKLNSGDHEQLPSASNFYDSAENVDVDSNDSAETEVRENNENHEQLPSASNFYDSAENVDINGKEDETDSDINVNSDEALRTDEDANSNTDNQDSDDLQEYVRTDDQNENNDYDEAPKPGKHVNEDYDSEENEKTKMLDRNLYEKYNDFRPHLNNYANVAEEANNEVDYNDDDKEGNFVYAPEDPVELNQMFNDEEVHKDRGKYNNYANDNSAVAY